MRKEVLRVSVGSINYNLNDEYSDVDYKLYIIPSFEDLYNRTLFSHSKKDENGNDIDIKDIRDLPDLIGKANINYLEPLFAIMFEPNKELDAVSMDYINYLLENREELVKINLSYFFDACLGMYYRNYPLIEKGTVPTKYLTDKYGYNTKAFMTCYRALDSIMRYYERDFKDFGTTIRYNDKEREEMLKMKHGFYTLEECKLKLEDKLSNTKKYEEIYHKFSKNIDLFEDLQNRTKFLIYHNLEQLDKKHFLK